MAHDDDDDAAGGSEVVVVFMTMAGTIRQKSRTPHYMLYIIISWVMAMHQVKTHVRDWNAHI